MTPHEILNQILEAKPLATSMAPKDRRGIYGLIDHLGELRYIGSTKSAGETFYKRIHQRHRTGSENTSHYFSHMYNTGRMWRLRNDPATKADGDIAKALRNAFIAAHCRAVWVSLPDDLDIAKLEAEVISLAPKHAIAWNRHGMDAYDEPADLVDLMIKRLGFGVAERAALDRQNHRYHASVSTSRSKVASKQPRVRSFPCGAFRFVALDVETANHDRSSICQIGVACVRHDNSMETWATYVDPRTSHWVFTGLHGISNATVAGAPVFEDVLAMLDRALRGVTVYQHSGFDRSAIRAACSKLGLPEPDWIWHNSVTVARQAWPNLKGNGGHGLASLKEYLGLCFEHHDAGEDARAAAEVVLRAERTEHTSSSPIVFDDEFQVIDPSDTTDVEVSDFSSAPEQWSQKDRKLMGFTVLTQGNLNNNHFYLRDLWAAFPEDCIGGANAMSAAPRSVTVHCGLNSPVVTDLDGKKKLFRKRGWVRDFFHRHNAQPGDHVMLHTIGAYEYEVSIQRTYPRASDPVRHSRP